MDNNLLYFTATWIVIAIITMTVGYLIVKITRQPSSIKSGISNEIQNQGINTQSSIFSKGGVNSDGNITTKGSIMANGNINTPGDMVVTKPGAGGNKGAFNMHDKDTGKIKAAMGPLGNNSGIGFYTYNPDGSWQSTPMEISKDLINTNGSFKITPAIQNGNYGGGTFNFYSPVSGKTLFTLGSPVISTSADSTAERGMRIDYYDPSTGGFLPSNSTVFTPSKAIFNQPICVSQGLNQAPKCLSYSNINALLGLIPNT